LAEGITSIAYFNVDNRNNWSGTIIPWSPPPKAVTLIPHFLNPAVDIAYNEPNKPGFSLVLSHDAEKGKGTEIVAKSDTPSMSLGTINQKRPCPGSPPSSNCTMIYTGLRLSYTGLNE
jgi:hypothetical protein